MIYLSCQPAIPRYTWEVEVYLENFIQMEVNPKDIQVVLGYDETKPELLKDWHKLDKHYEDVKFYFYKDTRKSSNTYQPSLQSHILEKHWNKNPWMQQEMVFFHDADFVFTKPFDFSPFLNDTIWYFSDTVSYIGGEYIRSKGEEVLDKMCEVVGIDKEIVIKNQPHSGGAQKLIKYVPIGYWKEVFDISMKLWEEVPPVSNKIKKEKKEKGESYHELQHWTMSMWAELWQGWKWGYETRVPKEFDFMFYTNPTKDWDRMSFFHNAGVTGQNPKQFFKGRYNHKLPYGDIVEDLDTSFAGSKYYELVQEVGKKSVLL